MTIDESGDWDVGDSAVRADEYERDVARFPDVGLFGGPQAQSNYAAAYGKNVMGYDTELIAQDSEGNETTVSPHRFSLYEPSPDDPLPWSYYSRNRFIGKEINVDMSGALRRIEALVGRQFVYVRDLPPSETLNWNDWAAAERARLLREAEEAALKAGPSVEIPLEEAWHEIDEVRIEQQVETVTKYRINWDQMEIEPFVHAWRTTCPVKTGRKVKQLKSEVRFDESTGKYYRLPTREEIAASIPALGPPPKWVGDRLPYQVN